MAITVREKPQKTGDHGTLLRPTLVGFEIDGVTTLRTWLGYEAIPSSDFWVFTVKRRCNIQVTRICDDPYIVHVAVALLDQRNERVCSLVSTHHGIGDAFELKPGTYKIVASLGMPVEVREIELAVRLFAHYEEAHGISATGLTARAKTLLPVSGFMLESSSLVGRLRLADRTQFGLCETILAFGGNVTPGTPNDDDDEGAGEDDEDDRRLSAPRYELNGFLRASPPGSFAVRSHHRIIGVADLSGPIGIAHVRRSFCGFALFYATGFGRLQGSGINHPARLSGLSSTGFSAFYSATADSRLLAVESADSVAHLSIDTGGWLEGISAESSEFLLRLVSPSVRLVGISDSTSDSVGYANAALGAGSIELSWWHSGGTGPSLPPINGLAHGICLAEIQFSGRMRAAKPRLMPPGMTRAVACTWPPDPPETQESQLAEHRDFTELPDFRPDCDATVP